MPEPMIPPANADHRPAITARARSLGFDAVGFADARDARLAVAGQGLKEFLAAGHHGTMDWLAETHERRSAPSVLWPYAKSAIVLALNYGPTHDPREVLARRDRAAISVYAQNRDYHDIIKGRLKELAQGVVKLLGGDVKVFVDTAPLMEKPLAALGGLGWQGKHTNLVSRDFGSWLFLGVILSDQAITPSESESDHCGNCRACLDVCPTDAFPAPYRLDARRCISYLTIEHKGVIDRALRPLMGNRIYGCDDCLAACPWNKFARSSREMKLAAREDLKAPELAALARLDDAAFREKFSGSPIKRIGRNRFLRNVAIAIGNSGDAALLPAAQTLAADESPVVRAMGVWALSRLLPSQEFADHAGAALLQERDPDVRDELLPHAP